MLLKNCWQVAAFSKEVVQALLPRILVEESVVLFRTSKGVAVAMEDRCPHRHVPLSRGRVEGDNVRCGYHGMCFDASGKCVKIPGQSHIPAQAKARVYPTVERYKFVWIWMGDTTLADPATVPDFHWMDDSAWEISEGYHLIKADYQLLNDNLLDLSHETFVHQETIGNEAVAESPLIVKVTSTSVIAHRDMHNCEPPPFYRANGYDTLIDRSHTTYYTPPGFHVIHSVAKPSGMSNEESAARGVMQERHNMNLITPQTRTSSHYFWAAARNYRLADTDLTKFIREQVAFTFNQDAEMLEAQQNSIAGYPRLDFDVTLKADVGVIQGRRMLAARLEKERIEREKMAG